MTNQPSNTKKEMMNEIDLEAATAQQLFIYAREITHSLQMVSRL